MTDVDTGVDGTSSGGRFCHSSYCRRAHECSVVCAYNMSSQDEYSFHSTAAYPTDGLKHCLGHDNDTIRYEMLY